MPPALVSALAPVHAPPARVIKSTRVPHHRRGESRLAQSCFISHSLCSRSAFPRFGRDPRPPHHLHKQLASDCSSLPENYSFQIAKTIHRARETNVTRIALQFPEGLILYATTISNIIWRHTKVASTLILGNVTYGACCIDDLSAKKLSRTGDFTSRA